MASTLKLDLPKRTQPGREAFDSSTQHVKSWLGNLPMANVGEATKQTYAAIVDMNGQDLPAGQRLRALELMLPALDYLNGELKKHFVGQPMPLSDRQARIAQLTRDLAAQFAIGYKIVAVDQANLAAAQQDRKVLMHSLYRAVQYLGIVLVKCYQAYLTYPRGLWSELHSLYAYAAAHNLESHPIHATDHASRADGSVTDEYKRTLLLALACPYRLRHGVVEQVVRTLRVWAAHCRLEPDGVQSEALFVVDLDSDQPPTYRNLQQLEQSGNRLSLNTEQLAEVVRGALAELRQTGKSSHKLSASTLRRLMLAWGVMPRRRFSRTRDHAHIITATGLSAIHYFLSGEAAFNTASDGITFQELPGIRSYGHGGHTGEFRELEPRETRRRRSDQGNNVFRLEGQARPTSMEETVARAAAGMRIDRSFQTQSWKMVNVSAGGYCLLWNNPETTRAQVGELIGIREQSDPDSFHWRLGIVRWMKYVEKRGLELGIQMLSPGAAAIVAHAETCADRDDCLVRGLLLPVVASISQQSSLLLPSPPFVLGSTAVIDMNGKELHVKLTKLVENTGSFAQFQFQTLETTVSAKAHAEPQPPAKFRELDDIWDIL